MSKSVPRPSALDLILYFPTISGSIGGVLCYREASDSLSDHRLSGGRKWESCKVNISRKRIIKRH